MKNYGKWIAAAEKEGWRVRTAKNGVVLYPSDGRRPIPIHSNHSERHHNKAALKGLERRLRGAGLPI